MLRGCEDEVLFVVVVVVAAVAEEEEEEEEVLSPSLESIAAKAVEEVSTSDTTT